MSERGIIIGANWVQKNYGDPFFECGCSVTGAPVYCPTHKEHSRGWPPHESARPCGCDLGASHICEWHASHGLSLPQRAVPVVTQDQRANAEQARVKHQTPSPDTFVDVARNVKLLPVLLPTDPKARKQTPIYSGVLKYFPKALAEVARVSYAGNEQHNPGEKLRWAREKSTDQEDCLVRHLLEAGTIDTDGQRHSAKVCWRALAMLELELEAEGK